jgi:hypothetical protein
MAENQADIEGLKAEEAALERRLAEVRERRAVLERSPGAREALRPVRPVRDVVLDLLQEARFPVNSLLLASVLRPLQGRSIAATRFGTLSNDEESSYTSSRPRLVYLCHCLTFDQGQAVKRFWARSNWPLADRVVGPMSGRILFLKGAAWTIEMARQVANRGLAAADPDMLNYVAADQARDAGIPVKRGNFPYGDWLEFIASAIERHAEEDKSVRERAAAELEQRLQERELLFGSRSGLVSLPGSSDSWRSAIDER